MSKTAWRSVERIIILLALLGLAPPLQAASAVMIWPVDPTLSGEEKATALWLENRGPAAIVLQTRIFAWSQDEGEERYQPQSTVVASPPMIRVAPGARQLVRIMQPLAARSAAEHAYRILIDEIPTPDGAVAAPDAQAMGVTFRMRYSVPLFTYPTAEGTATRSPRLTWRIISGDGPRQLEITNHGEQHARLADVRFVDTGRPIGSGLLGYVLAGATMRWPLPEGASGQRIAARLNATEVADITAP